MIKIPSNNGYHKKYNDYLQEQKNIKEIQARIINLFEETIFTKEEINDIKEKLANLSATLKAKILAIK